MKKILLFVVTLLLSVNASAEEEIGLFFDAPKIVVNSLEGYVSEDLVRMTYVISTPGEREFSNIKASFRFPQITPEDDIVEDRGYIDHENFISLKISMDGDRVRTKSTKSAWVGDRDVTDVLKEHGIPISLLDGDIDDALADLPASVREDLSKSRVLAESDMLGMVWANWTYKSNMEFDIGIEPGQKITLEVTFRPLPTYEVMFPDFFYSDQVYAEVWKKKYCLDPADIRKVDGGDKILTRAVDFDLGEKMLYNRLKVSIDGDASSCFVEREGFFTKQSDQHIRILFLNAED